MTRRASYAAAFLALVGVGHTVSAGPSDPEQGARLLVNTVADAVDTQPGDGSCASAAGGCSLRAAVMESNALAGRDTISIPAGTYQLTLAGQGETAGDLDLMDDVDLRGEGAGSTLVESAIAGERVFRLASGASGDAVPLVLMDGLSIQGGEASVGGGIYAPVGRLTMIRVEVSGNRADLGGGVMVTDDGVLVLDSSTVRDNAARQGGGVFLGVPVQPRAGIHTLRNVTLTGNTADVGGGIVNSSSATLANATVTRNAAPGGAGAYTTGSLWLVGSIVAGNTGPDCAGGAPVSRGHNIDGDGTCSLAGPGDLPATDPLLEPIANNGGDTATHMPGASSPVLEALPPGPDCPPADQRGIQRPQGPACDIGAVERVGVPATPDTPTPSPSPSVTGTTPPTVARTASPTVTRTVLPADTVTPTPTSTREPSPTSVAPPSSTPGGPVVCPHLIGRVPRVAIDVALADPQRVFGWNMLCNPSVPESRFNQRRRQLSLSNIGLAYHPLYNGLVYRCGCP
jgi:hypothetical protein